MNKIKTYQFRRNKYGDELLIDLIRLETLKPYLIKTPRHCLSYYDITLITKGSGRFALDDHEFQLSSNQLLFSAPGQVREWKVPDIPSGLVLIFEESFLCTFFNDALFVKNLSFFSQRALSPQYLLTPAEGDHLRYLMEQIEQEIAASKETHLLRALLYQALSWINTLYRSGSQSKEFTQGHKASKFVQLVDLHFREQHTVAYYANELSVTAGHLNDLVRKSSGKSAKQHIIDRLMTEAKRLLLYSDLSVTEIAWGLGFNDPSYFIRLFRNESGSSPLSYRTGKWR